MTDEKKRPDILCSCYSQKSREGEQFIPEHVFGYVLSGSSDSYLDDKTYTFKQGDYRFFRRNRLTKYIKYPPPGGEYRSVSVLMNQDILQGIAEEYGLHADGPYTGESALHLQPNRFFTNYIDSLTPYLDVEGKMNPALTTLKVKEAVMILLETNPVLKNVLFDFSEPGKIDLEAYMNEHFQFNVEMKRFAYLTGRSLATFKRDFEKIYHTSPQRWLQQRRLKEAFYLMKEKGWKASDVYLEVGFEDLSHFSFAFKKTFGVTPSSVVAG